MRANHCLAKPGNKDPGFFVDVKRRIGFAKDKEGILKHLRKLNLKKNSFETKEMHKTLKIVISSLLVYVKM